MTVGGRAEDGGGGRRSEAEVTVLAKSPGQSPHEQSLSISVAFCTFGVFEPCCLSSSPPHSQTAPSSDAGSADGHSLAEILQSERYRHFK